MNCFLSLLGVNFTETDVSANDARLSDANETVAAVIGGKEVWLNVYKAFSGHVTYDARVKDVSGSFSLQLTLNVFVLRNPCVHGDCVPVDSRGTCDDPQRAFSFDAYQCLCDVGYEGQLRLSTSIFYPYQ